MCVHINKLNRNIIILHTASYYTLHLTFVCPCNISIIVNDDQQDSTILAHLFIPNQLYMFRTMSLPIIRNIWL